MRRSAHDEFHNIASCGDCLDLLQRLRDSWYYHWVSTLILEKIMDTLCYIVPVPIWALLVFGFFVGLALAEIRK
jgi:hypothetical protein